MKTDAEKRSLLAEQVENFAKKIRSGEIILLRFEASQELDSAIAAVTVATFRYVHVKKPKTFQARVF